ncbi:Serine/threonine-protein kinase PknB [Rosistilla carotiformis]|uniref:Serine/threonine-protein kinase PknB n=1 Tax=Rosistilla carotiformis TaxID=2528017 RepID=A0A518JV73_9BACT|nr:protein kinase [Rosistilla carotiformis]QDV69428.1 Serine/threonine-protein kinase PknB [Rosistilla carotiformis]
MQRDHEAQQETIDGRADDEPDVLMTISKNWEGSLTSDAEPWHTLKATLGISGEQVGSLQQTFALKLRSVLPTDASGTVSDPSAIADADYQVKSLLGVGGMGAVYAARQQSMDRSVAIKVLKGDSARSESSRLAFVSEAIITGRLDHPNIVPIYDVGKQTDDALFYSMKQVEGVEWKKRFAENSVSENLEILLRVCDAIAFAHNREIIHRDLKPANIMLGPFGEVLVMDWGLAIPTKDHPRRASFPPLGAGGTPCYMAPEMVTNIASIDVRSDVYLLGGILFEIVTGKPPHVLNSQPVGQRERLMAYFRAAANNVIASTEEEGELLDIARKAIATDPADRYQTVPEFQAAIREYLSHEESIELAANAAERLNSAQQCGVYEEFSRARFGFETALEQWPKNERAAVGLKQANFAFASHAFERGDLDLAASLLDEGEPEHASLGLQIGSAIVDRDAKQKQLRRLRFATLAASLAVAIVSSVGALWINSERTKAMVARQEEAAQRKIAQFNELKASAAEVEAKHEADNAVQNMKVAERNAYYSDMLLLRQAWSEGNTVMMRKRLDRHRGADDGRGFEWGYWNRLANCEIFALSGHNNRITGVAYSPDGTRIATASTDWSVRVWDATTGIQLLQFTAHKGGSNRVSFSPDGTRLASCGGDQTVKIWNVETGKQILLLTGHTGRVNSVSYNAIGTRLASAGDDKLVKVWDAKTGQLIHSLTGHTGPVHDTSFGLGDKLASVSRDRTLRIWDAETGLETQTNLSNTSDIYRVKFSPNGTILATAEEESVKVRDAATGQIKDTLDGHLTTVHSLAFSPDGTKLCSGSWDRAIKIWDMATGDELLTLRGHGGPVFDVSFGSDGTRLASASGDHTAKVWDVCSSRESLILSNSKRKSVRSVCFSPDEKLLASTTWGNELIVWDAVAGQEKIAIRNDVGLLKCLAFSPDGTRLASGGNDSLVRIWDPSSLQEKQTLKGHVGKVTSVSFSPDGTVLVSTSEDRTVKVWDAVTGENTRTLERHSDIVQHAAFRPDGLKLATASTDKTVKLWDTTTWQETGTLNGHDIEVTFAVYSPDGGRLITADGRGLVKVWDEASGQLIQSLASHTDRISALSFCSDGSRIASVSRDGSVKVWDAETWQETLSLNGFDKQLNDVSFNSEGTQLITADTSCNLRVWDARQWTPELRMQAYTRSYLTVHRDRAKSLEELRASIRDDKTINDTVRQQASDWAELFWKNRN